MASLTLLNSMTRNSRVAIKTLPGRFLNQQQFKLQLQQQQKRQMSLGGAKGPKPEWTGADKIVRTYFPEDHQVSCAVLSTYFLLAVLGSLGGKKKEEIVADANKVVESITSGIPSIESPAFEAFVESINFEKLLENDDQLSAALESA